jgi:hypothetical protein
VPRASLQPSERDPLDHGASIQKMQLTYQTRERALRDDRINQHVATLVDPFFYMCTLFSVYSIQLSYLRSRPAIPHFDVLLYSIDPQLLGIGNSIHLDPALEVLEQELVVDFGPMFSKGSGTVDTRIG